MAAFNGGFPVSYQPYGAYGGGYAGYQPTVPQMQQPQQPQMMTPPTIRAEIVQVDGEDAANRYPVGAGASQMMIARDDSAIYVKTAAANGQGFTLDVFEKRPPAPPAPTFDPEQYVRKDELEMLVSAALAAQQSEQATRTAPVAARRASKKEDE